MKPHIQPLLANVLALLLAFVAPVEVRAGAAGSLDTDFIPYVGGYGGGYGAYSSVYSMAIQPDGKILLGGYFGRVNGEPRSGIARLNADGTQESTATFNPGTGIDIGNAVNCVAIQPDGKILLGGYFGSVNGEPRRGIARLNADGTLESTATFNPSTGTGVDVYRSVNCMAIQPDGKILLGGSFSNENGEPRSGIARLNADGTLESTATFNPGTGVGSYEYGDVYSMAIQPDGKILLGGSFYSFNGEPRNGIARLNADGTLESTATFNPGTGIGVDVYRFVNCMAIQPDGKILLGGSFSNVNGEPRSNLARLNPDGSVEGLNSAANGSVNSVTVQADGKILLGGDFTIVSGLPRNGIARINADGSLEGSGIFDTGFGVASGYLTAMALQADGRIVVGGSFTDLDGRPRHGIARLANDPAIQSLSAPDSTRVLWLRGGAAPEVEQVTFELSMDGGSNWTPLGTALRIAGGWEITGLNLPVSGSIRARARSTTGGDGWGIVEQTANFGATSAPVVTTAPAVAGDLTAISATLRVAVNPGNLPTTVSLFLDGVFHSAQAVPAGGSMVDVAIPATGLLSGTTHTVRADATNSAGSATGGVVNFTLPVVPLEGPEPGFGANVTGSFVRATAIQPDGKLVIAGLFSSVGGQPRNRIARLNPDGTVESTATFNPGAGPNARVNSVAIQPDGKILIAGFFTSVDGQPRNRIARINADGTLESTATFNPGRGADYNVSCMVLQPDGKILIGGAFTSVDGQPRSRIARLNADGTLESAADFAIGDGADGPEVYAIALQPDGKILIGGSFDDFNGALSGYRLARLNANGSVESPASFESRVSDTVFSIVVQPDGKILIGGDFGIARLNADGAVDTTFDPGTGAEGRVQSIALQTDGRILVAGEFDFFNDQPRCKIARVKADGSLEPLGTFNTGNAVNDEVYSVALQPDGRILLGGGFDFVNLEPHSRLALLRNGPATQNLFAPGNSMVRWMRAGTAPEVRDVTFDFSPDSGGNWMPLGTATRIAGGWEMSGLNLTAGLLRARGRTSGGFTNGSSGLIEQIASFPPDTEGPALTLPANITVEAADAAGAMVSYAASASDPAGVAQFSSTPASGGIFPLGTTTVNVMARDLPGNTSSGNFTVTVRDTTAPVVTILGSNPASVIEGATYTDAGATAHDLVSGNVTASIAQTGTVNTAVPGSYTITYSVTDGAGFTTQAVRIVNVVSDPATDHAPPTLNASSPKPGQKTTGASVRFAGSATDDTRVARVGISLNGGVPQSVSPAVRGPDFQWELSTLPENGLNTATVMAFDQFGKASAPISLSFTFVNLRPQFAGNYNGRFEATPDSPTPIEHEGLVAISVLPTGAFTGKVTMAGRAFPFAGTLLNDGTARFGRAATPSITLLKPGSVLLGQLALTLDTAPGAERIGGTLTQGTSIVATLAHADRALYTATENPVFPLMNVPAALADPLGNKGRYTAIFRAGPAPNNGAPADEFPRGHGWVRMSLAPTGRVTLVGRLADGSRGGYANALSKTNELPVFVPLYGNKGFISGRVAFDPAQAVTDARDAAMKWFKPANASDRLYPGGWPNGITTDFSASKFVLPARPTARNPAPLYISGTHNILGLMGAPVPAAITLTLHDGATPGFSNDATVDAASRITIGTASGGAIGAPKLKAVSDPGTGRLEGSFFHPGKNKDVIFKGIIFQKTHTAGGYFLYLPQNPPGLPAPSGHSGAVEITP